MEMHIQSRTAAWRKWRLRGLGLDHQLRRIRHLNTSSASKISRSHSNGAAQPLPFRVQWYRPRNDVRSERAATYPLEAQVYYVPDQLDNSRVTLRAEAGPGCVNDYLSESGSVTNRWT